MQPHFKSVDTSPGNSRINREHIETLRDGKRVTKSMAEEKKAQYDKTVAEIRELYDKLNINSIDRKF